MENIVRNPFYTPTYKDVHNMASDLKLRLIKLLAVAREIAANPTPADDPEGMVLASILGSVGRIIRHVDLALVTEDVVIAALTGRNGLELKIIALYCTASQTSCLRFWNDQLLDAQGIAKCMQSLPELARDTLREKTQEWAQGLNVAIDEKAPEFEIARDEEYLRISVLAKQVRRQKEFGTLFSVYSKFVHPTALSVLAVPNETNDRSTIAGFTSNALIQCREVLHTINARYAARGWGHVSEWLTETLEDLTLKPM